MREGLDKSAAVVRWSQRRVLTRAAGNVLLGVAVGLLSHYAVTDVVNASGQALLSARMADVAVERAAESGSRLAGRTPDLDLAGWGEEDGAYWDALSGGGPFARLVIAKMGLDCVVVKGAGPADLKLGPGWIPGTDFPAGTGNVGIAGHRTTYGSPFGRIDELVPGDEIALYSPYRRYTYEVTRTLVVAPDFVEVIAHTEEPMITLTACHPRGSARYRYVAQAKLVEVRRLAAGPPRER